MTLGLNLVLFFFCPVLSHDACSDHHIVLPLDVSWLDTAVNSPVWQLCTLRGDWQGRAYIPFSFPTPWREVPGCSSPPAQRASVRQPPCLPGI